MKTKSSGEVRLRIDGIPPSVNHYTKHTRSGVHYKTAEAKNYQTIIAVVAGNHRHKQYEAIEVKLAIYLGPGQRGDVDNFPKVVLDALVKCGVIRSDASIMKLTVEKFRASKPETTVLILWEK